MSRWFLPNVEGTENIFSCGERLISDNTWLIEANLQCIDLHILERYRSFVSSKTNSFQPTRVAEDIQPRFQKMYQRRSYRASNQGSLWINEQHLGIGIMIHRWILTLMKIRRWIFSDESLEADGGLMWQKFIIFHIG